MSTLRRLGSKPPEPTPSGDGKPNEAARLEANLEFLSNELMHQAKRAIIEERQIGRPGPDFEKFKSMVEMALGDDVSNTGKLLMARTIFLLTAAHEILGGLGIHQFNIRDTDFKWKDEETDG